jgi:hypothetical protein
MKNISSILFYLFMLCAFQGCIRLTGSAGYWHQGANDAAPKSKQVGFDTNNYVPGAPAPGSITTTEEK